MDGLVVRPATSADWDAIETLLWENGLPLDGARAHADTFRLATIDARLVGVAGLEAYGAVGLLRSVAVRATSRRRCIGSALVDAVTRAARGAGIGTLYLLTTTAADWFATRGFVVVDRADLPEALRSSAELRGACPDSATCMERRIDRDDAPDGDDRRALKP